MSHCLFVSLSHLQPSAFSLHPANASLRRRAGFTLVELLVVILIIAILVSVAIGLYQQARNATWKERARDSARQIAVAWNLKLLDDHAFPPATSFTDDSGTPLDANNTEITFPSSTNNMVVLNSTKIYLEQSADQRLSGMKDKWGNFFHVRLDLNYDGVVKDPRDPSGTTTVNANVLVWSVGPYGNTNSYCVASP